MVNGECKAFIITSESSELEGFSKTKFGYKACKTNKRLVSDLEPVNFNCEL
jgi:hypothetical protein